MRRPDIVSLTKPGAAWKPQGECASLARDGFPALHTSVDKIAGLCM
jgi:hypothetical protein